MTRNISPNYTVVLMVYASSQLFYPGECFFFFFNLWAKRIKVGWCCSVMSNCLRPDGQYPASLLCPLDFPGKNTGVGWHFLKRIFLTPGSNHVSCISRQIVLPLPYLGSPILIFTKFIYSTYSNQLPQF